MHSIFQNANYLPMQMWLYIYYMFVANVSTTFILKSKLKRLPTILLSMVILYISLFPQHFDGTPAWATQASIVSIILCDFFLYKERKHICLISSLISIAIIFVTDYLGYLIVVVLFNSDKYYISKPYVYMLSSMIIVFLFAVYILLWSKLYRNDSKIFFKNNIVFFILLLTLEIMFISFWIIDHNSIWDYIPYNFKNTNRSFFYFYIFMFIILDCIIVYFTKSSSSYYKIKSENKMLEYQNKLQTEYYQKMLKNYENTAKLRHDINNLVQVINIQLSENTAEGNKKATEIAQGITDIMNSTRTHQFCNNRIVNAVLFDKSEIAEKLSIKIVDNIILENNINVSDFDICRVFVNLLDNSINALKSYDGDDKTMYISCKEDNDYIYIKCENKFSDASKKQKKNTELHGYGLKIVKDITEKYNGELITKTENSTFSTLAVLKPILSQPVK